VSRVTATYALVSLTLKQRLKTELLQRSCAHI